MSDECEKVKENLMKVFDIYNEKQENLNYYIEHVNEENKKIEQDKRALFRVLQKKEITPMVYADELQAVKNRKQSIHYLELITTRNRLREEIIPFKDAVLSALKKWHDCEIKKL